MLKDGVALLYCSWFPLSSCGLLFFSLACVSASFTAPSLLHTTHPLLGVTVKSVGHDLRRVARLPSGLAGDGGPITAAKSSSPRMNDFHPLTLTLTLVPPFEKKKKKSPFDDKHGFPLFFLAMILMSTPSYVHRGVLLWTSFSSISVFFKRSICKRDGRKENSNQLVRLNPTVISLKLQSRANTCKQLSCWYPGAQSDWPVCLALSWELLQ